uniref:(northern house mosquito) hypothetical protein n=1 Tax=Culex pipiens TaxID=7175 RepID=A0A8D8FJM8_CULPI
MTHVRRELCLHKGLLVICNLSRARRDHTNFLPSASVSLLHIRNFHARSHTRSTRMCHATVAAQASLSLSLGVGKISPAPENDLGRNWFEGVAGSTLAGSGSPFGGSLGSVMG